MENMTLRINGEERAVPSPSSVRQLIRHLELAEERIAVEVNGRIVPRTDWGTCALECGDKVEIVHFVGGG